jgi:hypothetical protein
MLDWVVSDVNVSQWVYDDNKISIPYVKHQSINQYTLY